MASTAKTHNVISFLQALKKASKDLQNNPISIRSRKDPKVAIEALLELATNADTILSSNPNLSDITQSLTNLKELLEDLERIQGYGLHSLVSYVITKKKISKTGYEMEAKLQSHIDRESAVDLVQILTKSKDENEKVEALARFDNRLAQGFDWDYQELILRGKIFTIIESILCGSTCSDRLNDQAARAVISLVKFNRVVFLGMVLMGSIIQSLISTASSINVRVLYSLIRCAKTHLIEELQYNREISRIINLLNSEDPSVAEAALLCLFEIAFYGSKEVIEAMVGEELVQKLMELQRRKQRTGFCKSRVENQEEVMTEEFAFEDCVWRFAVQIQVGEGLQKKEKHAFKLTILEIVRRASVFEDCQIDILWGSSP
ncbi:hypothetical protein FNV43_RR12269 [Rhamnella rubrinervis]|uniref:Uncharacterized protein n=1 Tax=Rhamnella rubrinervis TaxID=2594499 RepID=A0A8K0H7W1_9ROSA|nr:hypothetical protein FNV43_RR12269 [Rhamnella rubrinervis]